jgi:hypothetical protein
VIKLFPTIKSEAHAIEKRESKAPAGSKYAGHCTQVGRLSKLIDALLFSIFVAKKDLRDEGPDRPQGAEVLGLRGVQINLQLGVCFFKFYFAFIRSFYVAVRFKVIAISCSKAMSK